MINMNNSLTDNNTTIVNRIIGHKLRFVIRAIFALIILYSVFHRITYSWNHDVHPLLFFTIQSNLMLALYWLASPFLQPLQKPIIHLAVTTYLFITGFIFIVFLSNGFVQLIYIKLNNSEITDITHYYSMISSIITHYLMPLLALLDFLFFTKIKHTKKSYLVLVYPYSYFIVSIILGGVTNTYAYPFLDPSYMGGYLNIGLVVIAFTVFLVGVTHLLVYLNECFQRKVCSRITNVVSNTSGI